MDTRWLYIQAMRIQKESDANEQTMPKQVVERRESSRTSVSRQEALNDGSTRIPEITENDSNTDNSRAINLAFHIER
nr:unnamed protein product [Callosobruchus chinensis]